MTIQRIYDFLTEDIWRHSQNDIRDKRRRYQFSVMKVLTLCVKGFINNNLNTWANSLTYSLVFAAVPILALVVAISQGFGVMNVIEASIKHTFLGEYDIYPKVMEAVERYLDTAHGGVFLGVGLLILIWAVYSFFRNVETCFNEIWDVKRSRSISTQVITYFAILFFMPILIVVSSGFLSFADNVAEALGLGTTGWFKNLLQVILPYLTTWVIFSAMYKFIPNTKVGFAASVIPGVFMGTMFQLLQWALVHFVVLLSRTSIVYGAFAVIPIMLMCSQWMCVLILTGTQLSFSIQNNEMFEYEKDIDTISHRYETFVALYITYIIVNRFRHAQPPVSSIEIAEEYHMPVRLVRHQLNRLVQAGVLNELLVEDDSIKLYQPAKDTSLLTIGNVEADLDNMGSEEFLRSLPADMKAFWAQYKQLKEENNGLKDIEL